MIPSQGIVLKISQLLRSRNKDDLCNICVYDDYRNGWCIYTQYEIDVEYDLPDHVCNTHAFTKSVQHGSALINSFVMLYFVLFCILYFAVFTA